MMYYDTFESLNDPTSGDVIHGLTFHEVNGITPLVVGEARL